MRARDVLGVVDIERSNLSLYEVKDKVKIIPSDSLTLFTAAVKASHSTRKIQLYTVESFFPSRKRLDHKLKVF